MTGKDWMIDTEKIKPDQVLPKISGVDALDHGVEQPYQEANLPFEIKVILNYTIYRFVQFGRGALLNQYRDCLK